jgi:hypothetical protein
MSSFLLSMEDSTFGEEAWHTAVAGRLLLLTGFPKELDVLELRQF